MALTDVYLTSNIYTVTVTDEDGAAVDGATVTATFYTKGTTTEIAGVVWPVTFTGTGGGTGTYTWTRAYNASGFADKTKMQAAVTVVSGALQAYALVPVTVATDVT